VVCINHIPYLTAKWVGAHKYYENYWFQIFRFWPVPAPRLLNY
jgi:hypothetical protein